MRSALVTVTGVLAIASSTPSHVLAIRDALLPDRRDTSQWQPTRGLRQEDPRVLVVKTPKALQDAIASGEPHIEIQSHLDLTKLTLLEGAYNSAILGDIGETLSIRVRFNR